ncbi:Tfx family DNA-binding protein [Halapricum desulfuricans]|uniref:Transcriptional regulator n=1 Tax=Halapricum desulfuricans TaxID=2841257 RepID=A0A897NV66_9EURY|nr:Tfx family DNA-binding protein [Halapricum desulfuricans]QSG15445.1 Transcriptional regulator [Halapricum desulfuricans]
MADGDADPLAEFEYPAEKLVLTDRQAEVLALRERGLTQAEIADRFDTTRANVANIESSARDNAEQARNTVAFLELLDPPVETEIEAHTSLFDVPPRVYSACDEADVKVNSSAVELVEEVRSSVADAIEDNILKRPIRVYVTERGDVRIAAGNSSGSS